MTTELIKIVGINGRFIHSCLALFYVRNELEKNCHEFDNEIVQFTINDNYYQTLLRLSTNSPGYIFFSAAIWNSSVIEQLVRDLNICLPDCTIVIGGPQAYILGKSLGRELCTVVKGEIEAVGKEFYEDLVAKSMKPRYEGSFFKMKGHSFESPYRGEDFTSHLKNRHIYYESSRGCQFACTYCLSSVEKGLYHKSLSQVETELESILRCRPKVIRFIDRTFNDVPARALAIWKFLAAQEGDTLFHFEIAPDRFTEDMFNFLATVDCSRFQFEIGVQSTHRPSLEAVRRIIDPDQVHDIVVRLAGFKNIHLHVDLILGLPFETRESFARSFRDLFAMGAHYIQMGLLKILPDTPISKSVEEFKYDYCVGPPYSILKTKWMDHDCLNELYWFSECVEKFMNNRYFVTLWSYLRRQREDVFCFFEALLGLCLESGFFQLAPTHELMTVKLNQLIAKREDRGLIRELLLYDWFRCGYRFLPDCLTPYMTMEQLRSVKGILYRGLPGEIEGVYSKGSRNHFFKKSIFMPISRTAIRECDLSDTGDSDCVCFLREREESLYKLNKVFLFKK
jgi:radical SAM superfamily enzyme YgiQ (UPF0313 family)